VSPLKCSYFVKQVHCNYSSSASILYESLDKESPLFHLLETYIIFCQFFHLFFLCVPVFALNLLGLGHPIGLCFFKY
jgi:hypothetical protein